MAENLDRYPGLRSFEEKDAALFFGRSNETEKLATLLLSERLLVLFGNSGVGKSSLLNTAFKKNDALKDLLSVKIRFQQNAEGGENLKPIEIIEKELFALTHGYNKNKIIFDTDHPQLWEYIKLAELSLRAGEANDRQNKTLVLIFDQFEEFFNLPIEEQNDFRVQLAELAHEMPPRRILDWITKIPDDQRNEEVLNWYKQPEVKIILSIRSDRLYLLGNLIDYMPQVLKVRFELTPFDDKNAAYAIECPGLLENTDRINFNSPIIRYDEAVITRIVDELRNSVGEIDSSLLQIVCWSMEQKAIELDQSDKLTDFSFSLDLFEREINMSKILDEFYSRQLFTIGNDHDILLARKAIEDELVKDGQRSSLLEKTLLKHLEGKTELLDLLIKSRLLKQERSASRTLYELSHDKLIAPVERAKTLRHQQEKLEDEKKKEMEELALKQKKALNRQKIIFVLLLFASLLILTTYLYLKASSAINSSLKNQANMMYNQNNHFLAFKLWDEDMTDNFVPRVADSAFKHFGKRNFYEISGGDGLISLSGNRVAVHQPDKTIYVWNIVEHKNTKDPVRYSTQLYKVIINAANMLVSYDRKFIVYRDLNNEIRLFNVTNDDTMRLEGTKLKSLSTIAGNARYNSFVDYKMAFIGKSNYLAFVSESGDIVIYDLERYDLERKKTVPLRILEKNSFVFTTGNINDVLNVSKDKQYISTHRNHSDTAKLYKVQVNKSPALVGTDYEVLRVQSTNASNTFVYTTQKNKIYRFKPGSYSPRKVISTNMVDILYPKDLSKAIIFEKKSLFIYDLIGDSVDRRFKTKQLYSRFDYNKNGRLQKNNVSWSASGHKIIVKGDKRLVLIDLNKAASFLILQTGDSSCIATAEGNAYLISPDETKYAYINQLGKLCVYPIDTSSTSFKGFTLQLYEPGLLGGLQNLYNLNALCKFDGNGTRIAFIKWVGDKTKLSVVDINSKKELFEIDKVASIGDYFTDSYIHVRNEFNEGGGLIFFNSGKRDVNYFKKIFPPLTDKQKREFGIIKF